VVPVAMFHTDKIQPTGQVIPNLRQVAMVFGEPMDFSDAGDSDNPLVLRRVTDEIMATLQKLSGQEYVDVYATVAKERLARGEEVTDDEV
jgi:1-acyl-sn-glycerol-3-phosphate acyltransferase